MKKNMKKLQLSGKRKKRLGGGEKQRWCPRICFESFWVWVHIAGQRKVVSFREV